MRFRHLKTVYFNVPCSVSGSHFVLITAKLKINYSAVKDLKIYRPFLAAKLEHFNSLSCHVMHKNINLYVATECSYSGEGTEHVSAEFSTFAKHISTCKCIDLNLLNTITYHAWSLVCVC